MMVDPVQIFIPTGSTIGSLIYGRPGSGKTFAIQHALGIALRRDDPEWRVVAVSPKNEDYVGLLAKGDRPVATADEALESIRRKRMTVVYPGPDVEEVVDDLIAGIFDLQSENPNATFTVILDDAQTFVESRKAPSPQIKRLYLTGRSKGIVPVSVSHAPTFSKLLDGNVGAIWCFSQQPIFDRNTQERYAFDASEYREEMTRVRYSSVFFTEGKAHLLRPLEVGRTAEGTPTDSPP